MNADDFPHRGPVPLRDDVERRKNVSQLVNKLLDLEAETHPASGTAERKEISADDALCCAAELMIELVSWAVDCRVGTALTKRVEWPSRGFFQSDREPNQKRDGHQLEAMGSRHEYSSPALNRLILADLLHQSFWYPDPLREMATEGLEALDFGEVYPLFERRTTKLKGPGYSLWWGRIAALGHVEFLRGCGQTDETALATVAKAFGEEPDNILQWRKRDTKTTNGAFVRHWMELSRNLGQEVAKANLASLSGNQDDTVIYIGGYTDEDRVQQGRMYQQIAGKKKRGDQVTVATETTTGEDVPAERDNDE